MSSARRCSGRRADGKPCRGWALRGSDPPLCYFHAQKQSRHEEVDAAPASKSFYSPAYTLAEIADLVGLAMDGSLDDELAATRIAVRRVMEQLQEELTPDEYAHMANLIFRGTNTVARLLRIKKSLSKELDEELAVGIGEALDIISGEKGIEL